jgi:hypothetical protein
VYETGCAGLITHSEPLSDGRYNIVLRGMEKFRIVDEDTSQPYRLAHIEALPEATGDAERAEVRARRQRLEAVLAATIERSSGEPRFPPAVPDDDLVNALAQYLPLEPVERQALLVAVRDNEVTAESVTMNTTRLKLTAFLISGAMAGFAGGIYVLQQNGLHTDSFDATVSIKLFSMVVIGGLGSLPGAVLGAVYVRGAEIFLPPGWTLIASGFGILLLLMFVPQGLGGAVYGIRDAYLRRVAQRRGILVPSLLADKREAAEDAPVAIGTALGGLSAAASTTAGAGAPSAPAASSGASADEASDEPPDDPRRASGRDRVLTRSR